MALQHSPALSNQILAIGALPPLAAQVAELLPGASFTLVTAPSWEAGRRELADWVPAAILLAPELEGDPLAALKWVRARERLAFVPLLLFAVPGREVRVSEGIAAGADEVVANALSAADVLECMVA